MTKHEGFTPGPWTAEDDEGSWSVYSDHETLGGCIAVAYGYRAEANARLIADAPRLYAENQRLRDVMRRVAYGLAVDARTLDGMTKDAAVTTLMAALGADA